MRLDAQARAERNETIIAGEILLYRSHYSAIRYDEVGKMLSQLPGQPRRRMALQVPAKCPCHDQIDHMHHEVRIC